LNKVSFYLLASILTAILSVLIFSSQMIPLLNAQSVGNKPNKKVVILNFDDFCLLHHSIPSYE
jgi:hypothetical protein